MEPYLNILSAMGSKPKANLPQLTPSQLQMLPFVSRPDNNQLFTYLAQLQKMQEFSKMLSSSVGQSLPTIHPTASPVYTNTLPSEPTAFSTPKYPNRANVKQRESSSTLSQTSSAKNVQAAVDLSPASSKFNPIGIAQPKALPMTAPIPPSFLEQQLFAFGAGGFMPFPPSLDMPLVGAVAPNVGYPTHPISANNRVASRLTNMDNPSVAAASNLMHSLGTTPTVPGPMHCLPSVSINNPCAQQSSSTPLLVRNNSLPGVLSTPVSRVTGLLPQTNTTTGFAETLSDMEKNELAAMSVPLQFSESLLQSLKYQPHMRLNQFMKNSDDCLQGAVNLMPALGVPMIPQLSSLYNLANSLQPDQGSDGNNNDVDSENKTRRVVTASRRKHSDDSVASPVISPPAEKIARGTPDIRCEEVATTPCSSSSSPVDESSRKKENDDDDDVFINVEYDQANGRVRRDQKRAFYSKVKQLLRKTSSLTCKICLKEVMHNHNSVADHVAQHSGGKQLACFYCGWTTFEKNQMGTHMKKFHPDKKEQRYEDIRDLLKMIECISVCFPISNRASSKVQKKI